MNEQNVLEEIQRVFGDVLDIDTSTISFETTAEDIEEWDSLTHVQLIVAIEKKTGHLVGQPEVVSRGFVDIDESEELLRRTQKIVVTALKGADHIAEWGVVNTKIKDAVARFLYEETHRRPMVLPVNVEV